MATKPSLSIFTGDKNLGTVYQEQNQINVKFFEVNIPFSDTQGRIGKNIGGKNRIIMVQGAHDGTGFDGATAELRLKDFIYEMEQWVNTGTQGSITYTDSVTNTYNVDAVDWMWTRSFSDSYRILYTLIMKEVW